MLLYLDREIKSINLVSKLMGTVSINDKALEDNLLNMLKSYNQSHQILVDYKVMGKRKALKEVVCQLILSIVQELLYIVVQRKFTANIRIRLQYKPKLVQLTLEYPGSNLLLDLTESNSGLNYQMLCSGQSRLNLVAGHLLVNNNRQGDTIITIQLPLNQMTCLPEGAQLC